jgi:hypothetical protein
MKTKLFECLEGSEYAASSDKLLPGDILVNPKKHTAVVVESPNVFTYKVRYTGTDGKRVKAEIEEYTEIIVNPNNDSRAYRIRMDSNKSLPDSDAVLANHDFAGWKKTGERAFTATYKPKRDAMVLNTERIEIKDTK